MRDEARRTDERLAPKLRSLDRLAIGEKLAGVRTQQNAVGVVQGQKCADRQLARAKDRIEARIAVEFALRGQLRHLPAHPAFGAHLAAIERIQRLRVAPAWLIAATEALESTPSLRRSATPAKADPAQLHCRKAIPRVVLQFGHCTLCGRAQLERVRALRGGIVQQRPQGIAALLRIPLRRQHGVQIACLLRLRQGGTRTRQATFDHRCRGGCLLNPPAHPPQQHLHASGIGCGCRCTGCRQHALQQLRTQKDRRTGNARTAPCVQASLNESGCCGVLMGGERHARRH